MSVDEMKKVITERVENLSSEDDLNFVINVLNNIDEGGSKKAWNVDSIFEEAVAKYGSVLKKLAE